MRNILFVLALLGAVSGRGQIVLDWYGSAAPAAGLLLDDYPGAAAAFSLRLLRTAYTGDCIEVRRSNDNATQDIGFAGGVLDTADLKTFCGANDCFVRTWYDQAGSYDGVQTTNANQPLIVSGGVINRTNGLPSMLHDGTDVFSITSFPNLSTFSTVNTFSAFNRLSGSQYIAFGNNANIVERVTTTGSVVAGYENTNRTFGTYTGTGLQLFSYIRSTDVRYYINGVQFGSTFALSTLRAQSIQLIHGFGGLRNTNGNSVFELIFYTTDESSNRAGIESNINAFYSIY